MDFSQNHRIFRNRCSQIRDRISTSRSRLTWPERTGLFWLPQGRPVEGSYHCYYSKQYPNSFECSTLTSLWLNFDLVLISKQGHSRAYGPRPQDQLDPTAQNSFNILKGVQPKDSTTVITAKVTSTLLNVLLLTPLWPHFDLVLTSNQGRMRVQSRAPQQAMALCNAITTVGSMQCTSLWMPTWFYTFKSSFFQARDTYVASQPPFRLCLAQSHLFQPQARWTIFLFEHLF